MEKLFVKFTRLNREKASSRSTGLGLFIAKDIIEKHGGMVHAESKKKVNGFNVIFTLPRLNAVPEEDPKVDN